MKSLPLLYYCVYVSNASALQLYIGDEVMALISLKGYEVSTSSAFVRGPGLTLSTTSDSEWTIGGELHNRETWKFKMPA